MSGRPFATDRDPWERQPGERANDFALFARWLRASPAERKYGTFSKEAGVSYGTLSKRAREWRWADRLSAYEGENERTALLAVRDTNKAMASQLASVMGKIPQAMDAALRLGMRTIDEYLTEMSDPDGERKLTARDAVALMAAANALGATATRYLETAGELTRRLEVSIAGRVQHVMVPPKQSELLAFVHALEVGGLVDNQGAEILEAAIVEELPALEAGDDPAA